MSKKKQTKANVAQASGIRVTDTFCNCIEDRTI